MPRIKTLDELRKARMRGISVNLEDIEDVNENPLIATLFQDAYVEGFFDEYGYFPNGDEPDELSQPVVEKLNKNAKKAS